MQNAKTLIQWSSVKSSYTSPSFSRKHPDIWDERIEFITSPKSSAAIRIETCAGDSKENYDFFKYLKDYSEKLFKVVGGKQNFKVTEAATKHSISFSAPEDIAPPRKDLSSKELEAERNKFIDWVAITIPLIEKSIIDGVTAFESSGGLGPPESQIDEVQEDSNSENGPGQPVSSPETVSD